MEKLLINKNQQEEYFSQVFEEKSKLQNMVGKLQSKVQNMEQSLNSKDDEVLSQRKTIETLESALTDKENELNNQISINTRLAKAEIDLRSKIENTKTRVVTQDEAIRKTAEENYMLKSEIKNLEADLQNIGIYFTSISRQV